MTVAPTKGSLGFMREISRQALIGFLVAGCAGRLYGRQDGAEQSAETACTTDADCTSGSCDPTTLLCVSAKEMCPDVPPGCRPCSMNGFGVDGWGSLDCPIDMVCDAAAGCCVVQPACALTGGACATTADCCNTQCRGGVCQKQPNGASCSTNDDCYDGNCGALGVCQIGGQVCTGTPADASTPSCTVYSCVADGAPGSGGGCCSGEGNADGFCVALGARAIGLACAKDAECYSLRCGPDCRCLSTYRVLAWPDGTGCNSGDECAGGLCDLHGKCRSSCAVVGAACAQDADCCGGMCGASGICVALDCSSGAAASPGDATSCCSGQRSGGTCQGPACRDAGRTCTRDSQCCSSGCDGAPMVGVCH